MAKSFQLRRLLGGRRHVLVFDSAADYLRCLVDEMAGDFDVRCDVSVTESDGGWLLVEARSPTTGASGDAPAAEEADCGPLSETARAVRWRFGEFCDELTHVFGRFYEGNGGARGPVWRAWRVRHRDGCPWI